LSVNGVKRCKRIYVCIFGDVGTAEAAVKARKYSCRPKAQFEVMPPNDGSHCGTLHFMDISLLKRYISHSGSVLLKYRLLSMASDDDLLHWSVSREECCARIERNRSPIKIVLKTKNDPFFIERWIKHHTKIVGNKNLIIFDNMSDDREVLSVYEEYRDQVEIIRFSGSHNDVHHTLLYRELYRSLARSSEFCIFLDTDEYLILIEDNKYFSDDRIVTFVGGNKGYDLFPSTWLWNVNWSPVQFSCGTEVADLANKLACGKPLIRSDAIPTGYFNHNFQLGSRIFAPPFKTNLFLLHLAHLYPQQRISTNMNKLISRGLARTSDSPESLAQRDDITDGVPAGYVKEIRDFLALDERQTLGKSTLRSGCLELSPNQTISYYSHAERKAIDDFISDPQPAYDSITNHYRLSAVSS
jgi:hypothetical protein